MRAWDAFTGLDSLVKNMVTSLRAVGELQNPAIRDRHWEQLMQATQVSNILNIELYTIYLTLPVSGWMLPLRSCEAWCGVGCPTYVWLCMCVGEVCDVRRDKPVGSAGSQPAQF